MKFVQFIQNPLTLIFSFSGIVEIVSWLVYRTDHPHPALPWFIVGYPTLVLILVFGTLLFRREALYSPSDFRDETNFVKLIVSRTLDYVSKNVEVSLPVESESKIPVELQTTDGEKALIPTDTIRKALLINVERARKEILDTPVDYSHLMKFLMNLSD